MLQVGRIDKPHGLRGEVIVTLTTNRDERLAPGSVLRLDGAAGREVTVVSAVPYQHRWLVAFDGVYDRNGSEAISHRDLYAEPIEDPDALFVHDLIGRAIRDQTGAHRGVVTAIEANPASDLLVLDTGALVPLRFVVSTATPGVITVDVPDGLFDLA